MSAKKVGMQPEVLFKEVYLLLKNKGFWRFDGNERTAKNGTLVEIAEHYQNQDGVVITLYEFGPRIGKVSISLTGAGPWVTPVPQLGDAKKLEVFLEVVEELLLSEKASVQRQVHPGMKK